MISRNSSALSIRRGNTWVVSFQYTEDDEVTPVDLTGYEARMQIRTLDTMYGEQDPDDGLIAAYATTGVAPKLVWDTASIGKVVLTVPAADTDVLNPDNVAKVRYAYGVEAYTAGGVVIQLATGKLTVRGEVVR